MGGRGLHEKAIGELKTGLAFDSIPTGDYQANSVWQQFVVLAHPQGRARLRLQRNKHAEKQYQKLS